MVTNEPGNFVGHHVMAGKVLEIEVCLKKNVFRVGVEGTATAYNINEFLFGPD